MVSHEHGSKGRMKMDELEKAFRAGYLARHCHYDNHSYWDDVDPNDPIWTRTDNFKWDEQVIKDQFQQFLSTNTKVVVRQSSKQSSTENYPRFIVLTSKNDGGFAIMADSPIYGWIEAGTARTLEEAKQKIANFKADLTTLPNNVIVYKE